MRCEQDPKTDPHTGRAEERRRQRNCKESSGDWGSARGGYIFAKVASSTLSLAQTGGDANTIRLTIPCNAMWCDA